MRRSKVVTNAQSVVEGARSFIEPAKFSVNAPQVVMIFNGVRRQPHGLPKKTNSLFRTALLGEGHSQIEMRAAERWIELDGLLKVSNPPARSPRSAIN